MKINNDYVDIVDKDTLTYEIENRKSPKFRNLKMELYQVTGYDVIVVV